jgi:hypothetical protein
MSESERVSRKGKDVTGKMKRYLRTYKTKSHINIKTKPSKKKLKTVKKKKKVRTTGGG